MSFFACFQCFKECRVLKRRSRMDTLISTEQHSAHSKIIILKPQNYSQENPLRLSTLSKDVTYKIAPGVMFYTV